ncbi:hypothetical protein OQH60_06375 [Campylobacter sp. MIT 21-1685]|uniref:CmeU family protein n=1 Tax=unclassified Campylobacter TaxID=2593542 RepID=UPI00224A5D78|nr:MULTISPECIES: CmeU family protein [unclassified Campylobacter]MCX2683491.1 hypothetical protein [Campylobacter sp. MIT 21-1684]MCX2751772.1 hypothetical protein [Campylobacter sp. MIT 21-1682]MCX2807973.1 hypothetical protein [Campylobacter sp. MIT 21-1685]
MEKEKIVKDLNTLFKQRAMFYAFFDKHIPTKSNTKVFDFDKATALDSEETYKQFYHFDYAIRKLLPAIFKAYGIADEDLEKDF